MERRLFGHGGDRSAAVAPTVALSLFLLIGAGGVAFDFARMAALDSELQNAADQAALAAATQLDQQARALQRATAAAQGLINNETLAATGGGGRAINIPTLIFYPTKADAENNTNGFTDVTRFADARFVRVGVAARRTDFALTPIIGILGSPNLNAEAVAGLGSAICKTPPVMICNPDELTTGDFNIAAHIGVGIKLVSVSNGGGAWAPGNFGYLDSGGGSNGAPGLREDLGWLTPPGECSPTSGVDTKPGASVSVTDALNTRFDIYDSNTSCQTGGACPPSINTVKDVHRPANASGNNACRMHNAGWQEVGSGHYLPTSATTALPATIIPSAMGHPRDMCHAVHSSATGYCTSPVGNGTWDKDAYFRANYKRASDGSSWNSAQWKANTGLTAAATRYQVYAWEIANRGRTIDDVIILDPTPAGATGNALVGHGKPVCSQLQSPSYGSGQVPGGTLADRRRISVAVINCVANSVNGNSTGVPVSKWIEAFLVEPSLNRGQVAPASAGQPGRSGTGQGDVYIEVIGETQVGAGATAGQVIRRDVPYLVK
ncbi:MAG TPA: pilus assembly protein TadG-related protein [Sphingomicrobium sp.]|nr:pilus assembly protein TadG-related protein [Sphingomicrobium sp.]